MFVAMSCEASSCSMISYFMFCMHIGVVLHDEVIYERNFIIAAMNVQASIPGPAANLSFTLSNGNQENCSLMLEPSSLLFQSASLHTAEVRSFDSNPCSRLH